MKMRSLPRLLALCFGCLFAFSFDSHAGSYSGKVSDLDAGNGYRESGEEIDEEGCYPDKQDEDRTGFTHRGGMLHGTVADRARDHSAGGVAVDPFESGECPGQRGASGQGPWGATRAGSIR